MPQVELEPTISVLERAETVRVVEHAATVIDRRRKVVGLNIF
jgi:hypothetical protein